MGGREGVTQLTYGTNRGDVFKEDPEVLQVENDRNFTFKKPQTDSKKNAVVLHSQRTLLNVMWPPGWDGLGRMHVWMAESL